MRGLVMRAERSRRSIGEPARRGLLGIKLDVGGADLVALAQRAGALEQVLEFAHVTGKA